MSTRVEVNLDRTIGANKQSVVDSVRIFFIENSAATRLESGIDPRVDGELGQIEVHRWWNGNIIGGITIKAEGLTNFTRSKRYSAVFGAVIIVCSINKIAFSFPPTDHSTRRGCARAFTKAARVINPGDLSVAERAIEQFYFINESVKIAGVTGIERPDDKW